MTSSIRRLVAGWLTVCILMWAPAAALAQPPANAREPELWRAMLERLPPGSLVAVQVKSGRRIKGTVLDVGESTFTFKPRTRIPVPAYEVAFAEVATIERQKPGISPGKKVLLGAGIGAAVYVVVVALLLATLEYD